MGSDPESKSHSLPPNAHVNLQHSLGLLSLNSSVTQDQTPAIGASGAPKLGASHYASSRTTKKKNRRVQGTAADSRRQRLKISTRLYHRQLRAQIQSLTRKNERLMEIDNLRLAADAAGLNVQLRRSFSSQL